MRPQATDPCGRAPFSMPPRPEMSTSKSGWHGSEKEGQDNSFDERSTADRAYDTEAIYPVRHGAVAPAPKIVLPAG
ncbi:MAG: hypothetical protein ACI9OJ_000779 [Myxococcota bacterium]|jgi:hypothetical protein